jgi:hypothetical protein
MKTKNLQKVILKYKTKKGGGIKKVLFILGILMITISCYQSKLYVKEENRWANMNQFTLGTITGHIYNKVYNKQFPRKVQISCQPKHNLITIYFEDYLNLVRIEIMNKDRLLLIDYIDKYLSWHKQAIKNKEKLQKNIGEFEYYLSWYIVDTWHYESTFVKGSIGTLTFFSQNIKKHQLVFSFSKSYDKHNKYITKKPETLYFNYNDIIKLRRTLELFNIQDKIKKQMIENNKKNNYE